MLKPNEFQEFALKEKTVISHNVAMSVNNCSSMSAFFIDERAATDSLYPTLQTYSAYPSVSISPWVLSYQTCRKRLSDRIRQYPPMRTMGISTFY